MKRIYIACLTITLCLAFSPNVFGNEAIGAAASTSAVSVDGSDVLFEAYNIEGSNFFKLRDLAAALNNTAVNFAVDWNEGENAIEITTGTPYETDGTELSGTAAVDKTAIISPAKIIVDGESIGLTAYNIDGNTYFKLRDIGEIVGFAVDFDPAANTVLVSSTDEITVSGESPNAPDEPVGNGSPLQSSFIFPEGIFREYEGKGTADGQDQSVRVNMHWQNGDLSLNILTWGPVSASHIQSADAVTETRVTSRLTKGFPDYNVLGNLVMTMGHNSITVSFTPNEANKESLPSFSVNCALMSSE